MLRQHVRALRLALLLADGAAATTLFVVVAMFRLGPEWRHGWLAAGVPWWVWATSYGIVWVIVEWTQEMDRLRSRWTFRGELIDILRAVLVLAVSVFSLLFLVRAPDVSRFLLIVLFLSQIAFSIVQRRLFRWVLTIARNRNIGTRNLIVLGTSETAASVAERLERHAALGYRVAGHLGTPSAHCPVVLGPLNSVEQVVHSSVVDEVVAVLDPTEYAYLEPIVALCQQEGKRLRVVLTPGLSPLSGGRLETLGNDEIVTISNGPDRVIGTALKRLLDVSVAGAALVLLSPLILLIALAVQSEGRGCVLFRQVRIGRNGRTFRILKFRTMVPDAESLLADLTSNNEIDGPAFKMDHDPRITPLGRLLRRTSLDEVPQFWNVLCGEMSIVGPRPPLPAEVAEYDLWHRRRLSMKPGITGLWQVSARLEPEFDRWVELDLRYIDRWSLWLDLKIMARTLPAMLAGR